MGKKVSVTYPVDKQSFEGVEDRESNGYIKYYSCESRSYSSIETEHSFILENVFCASHKAVILLSLETLHICLNHIYRIIKHDRTETSKSTSK